MFKYLKIFLLIYMMSRLPVCEAVSVRRYQKLLFKRGEANAHLTPWGQVVLRNIRRRRLVTYRSLRSFRSDKTPMWVQLQLFCFQDPNTNDVYPIFKCCLCSVMERVETLHDRQDKRELEKDKVSS